MPDSPQPGYAFAGFRLAPDGTLFRGQTVVHLPPKELAALRFLLAHAGQIVTPLQLRHELWGDVHVSADSVPKCLSSLRARLEPEECIQTVYKRGYRFTAEVRLLGAGPAGALPRLAILPFETAYGFPEHAGLAVVEETISKLVNARPPFVSVLARDSVFHLSRQGLTAQKIGEALNADLVLMGSMRALPSHYRLRAEMIRVADGIQIWVEDLLVPQSRIAGLESELVERLLFRLSAGFSISAAAEPAIEPDAAPQNREAYEIYLRARYEWRTLERHRMQDGLQHLSRATELDPSLIAAKVDLVRLCVTQTFYGYMTPAVAADLLRRTAESIPDLPHRAEAILPALGWVKFHFDHNLPAALWAFSLSAHLPHDLWTTRERAQFALSRHRFDEAIALLRAALQEDPYAPWLHARLAWTFHLAGQAAESLEQIRHSLALFPGHDGVALYGSMILGFNGDAAGAVQLAGEAALRRPYIDLLKAIHAYALACAGRLDEAHAILERLQWLSRERFVMSSFTPAVCVALGDREGALAALRTADQDRCPWFFQMLADPRLKPLHTDPEFDRMRAILTRMEEAAARSRHPE